MPSIYSSGLQPHQIDDLVENTLRKYEKDVYVDVALDLQTYFAWDNMLLAGRTAVDGGEQLQWQIKLRNTGSARNTGLFAQDDVKVADVSKSAVVPWTKQTGNMGYDIHEAAFNSGDLVRIVNLINMRRHDALSSLAELMEENFWSFPVDPTVDSENLKPYGVPYWIVRDPTTSAFAFNGGVPNSNHTTVGGVSPTAYANWKNGTGRFVAVSKRDMVRLLREACRKCKFKAPVRHPRPDKASDDFIIATTYEVESRMEEMLEEQNTNLGNDIASKDGQVVFRKVPVEWVPYLDDVQDTSGTATLDNNAYGKNPIYGLNRAAFQMVFLRGQYMVRTPPYRAPLQHSVRHVHWDTWMNFRCFNRRRNFVLTQAG